MEKSPVNGCHIIAWFIPNPGLVILMIFTNKSIVQAKMKILSSFTHIHVILKVSSVEYKWRKTIATFTVWKFYFWNFIEESHTGLEWLYEGYKTNIRCLDINSEKRGVIEEQYWKYSAF